MAGFPAKMLDVFTCRLEVAVADWSDGGAAWSGSAFSSSAPRVAAAEASPLWRATTHAPPGRSPASRSRSAAPAPRRSTWAMERHG